MAVDFVRPVRRAIMLALAGVAAHAAPATAADGILPPRWEALVERLEPTLVLAGQLDRGGVADGLDARTARRCVERTRLAAAACARGQRVPPLGCAARLASAARRLDAAVTRTPEAGAWIGWVAGEVARLALLAHALDRDRACDPGARSDDVPGTLAWRDGGTLLVVEPAAPLLPGRRYRLLLGGAAAPTPRWLKPALEPPGRLVGRVPAHTGYAPIDAYATRVTSDAAHRAGLTVRPSIGLRLGAGLSLEEAFSLSPVFHVMPANDADATGILVDVAAPSPPPAPLGPTRGVSPRPLGPEERAALGLGSASLPGVDVYRGAVTARDTREVPYLAAVPRGAGDTDGAVVLLLDGLGGSAVPFLQRRGARLLADGRTVVAMDLPGHGMRADDAPFLDPHDPSVLARRLRAAIDDVHALTARLRGADATAPSAPPATTIDVLAYSIGAAVAAVALAEDPSLGTAVLVAPPGDLAEFLSIATSATFGLPLLRCLAGSGLGAGCTDNASCPAGACILNPRLVPLITLRTAERTVLADVDPQTRARAIAGPSGTRPVLIQIGGRDGVIAPANTAWLAAALGSDMTCTRRPARPQTLCRFPDAAHDVVWDAVARRQADVFLRSHGRVLEPTGEPWATR